jgi:hypothetical protein
VSVITSPVGTILAWPPDSETPADWLRCRRQPVVEFPCLELVVEVMAPQFLVAGGFVDTPAGWLLPDEERLIVRVLP